MCFSSAGFGNAIAFKTIGEVEIRDIEKYNSSLISSFHFRPGDIKYIQELVAYVQKVVDGNGKNSGLSHFAIQSSNTIQSTMECSNFEGQQEKNSERKSKTHYFLNKLLSTADRNSNRKPGGFRYDSDIKYFAAFLRMLTGGLAYDILQRNLMHCLPSLSSTNRYVQTSGCHVTEGILRCEELAIYLAERSLKAVVCLSEDATRITGRVQYDSKTNQLVGFVLPTSTVTGMPIPFMYPARNAEEILAHFSANNTPASFLNVVMAQPIANVPAFCLLMFSSDSKYNSNDVRNRWEYITAKLESVGIKVLTISSDSDAKFNKAMRLLSRLGLNTSVAWFSNLCNSNGPFFIQDTVHILTKLRNLLLRTLHDKKKLPFGNGLIRIEHLYDLMNMFSKDKHLLTASTLNPVDRQNFKSVVRICHKRVSDLLRDHVNDSHSTNQYLQIMRDIMDSFMDHNLSPLQRVRKIWYSLFLIRIWRQFVLSNKSYTLKDNFLTANCYACIELNAHNLVQCIVYLKKINKPEFFKPFLFESQPCESLFRQLRSMSTVYSTVTNCTVKEALSRISNIQFQNKIMQNTSEKFEYRRFDKPSFPENDLALPTVEEIFEEIEFCKKIASVTAKKLGLIKTNEKNDKNYECKIKPVTSTAASETITKLDSSFNINKISLTTRDLKHIQLKNYANKVERDDIDGTGPYVQIKCNNNKQMIVKKTSLCWLLGTECKKLSSDRLLRVMHSTKHNTEARLRNQIHKRSLFKKKSCVRKNKLRTKRED